MVPNPAAAASDAIPAQAGRCRAVEHDSRTRLARSLRHRGTEAEGRLWTLLRHRRLSGFKFRRQVPIGRYVVDFACYAERLVVELDGSQHDGSMSDRVGDAELERRGFRVLRFWNSQLNSETDAVLQTIWLALHGQMADTRGFPSSALRAPSPTRGEGYHGNNSTSGGKAVREMVQLAPGSAALSPSPLVGEGARRADEGEAQ